MAEEFCSFCGEYTEMERMRPRTPFDFRCLSCGMTLRYRSQAETIVAHFGQGRFTTYKQAIEAGVFRDLSIYEVAIKGPFRRTLKDLPNYRNSYYWEDVPPGGTKDGVQCQDLRRLTFSDETFDLVISTEVMEHVENPLVAFREIHRVLKPGGCYIFTIPVKIPLRQQSTTRAATREDGTLVHIHKPVYHDAGVGGKALVFTDFGADLFEQLNTIGFHVSHERVPAIDPDSARHGTFCAVKIGAGSRASHHV